MIAIADQKGEVGKITAVTVAADDAFEIAFYFSITPKAFILIIRSEGLITRRSQVQVLPPLYFTNHSSQSYGFRLSPKYYGWQKFQNWRFLYEP